MPNWARDERLLNQDGYARLTFRRSTTVVLANGSLRLPEFGPAIAVDCWPWSSHRREAMPMPVAVMVVSSDHSLIEKVAEIVGAIQDLDLTIFARLDDARSSP